VTDQIQPASRVQLEYREAPVSCEKGGGGCGGGLAAPAVRGASCVAATQ
jgi:hypothetical protein